VTALEDGNGEDGRSATKEMLEMTAVLRRVEAELDGAAAELRLTTPPQPPRVFGAAAAASFAAARSPTAAPADAASTASTKATSAAADANSTAATSTSVVPQPAAAAAATTAAAAAEGAAAALGGGGQFRAPSELRALAGDLLSGIRLGAGRSEWDALEGGRRQVAAMRALPVEAAKAVIVEATRRALAAIAAAAAAAAAGTAAAARAAKAAVLEDADAALQAVSAAAAAAIGPAAALRCLQVAAEDSDLKPLLSAEAAGTPEGAAMADAVTAASLDLVAAHGEAVGREAAAARALEPLDAHLWRPPPPPLGRFPQLRAIVQAEAQAADTTGSNAIGSIHNSNSGGGGCDSGGGGGGGGSDAALGRLPFVRRREQAGGVDGDGGDSGGWELAVAHDTPIEPILVGRRSLEPVFTSTE